MTDAQTLIATREVANRLGVTVATVSRMVKRGDLPAVQKLPGRTGAYLFDRAEIEKLADA